MKKIYKLAAIALALLALAPCNAFAQTNEEEDDSGVRLKKTVAKDPNDPSQYLITLEAYAVGNSAKSTTHTSVPTDIVLVLDVSGSMGNDLQTFSYTARTRQGYTYSGYGNSAYYYKDGDNYYKVLREQGSFNTYTARTSQGYTYNGYTSAYYYKDGDNYYQVSRSTGTGLAYTARTSQGYTYRGYGNSAYYYKDEDDYYQVLRDDNGMSGNAKRYRLYYMKNGVRQELGSSSSNNDRENIWTGILYSYGNATVYRLSYTKDNTTYYLTTGGPTTTPPTNVTSNTGTIWTGVLYTASSQNTYRLTYYKDGKMYYLTSGGITTIPPTDVTSDRSTIWTGVLYTRSARNSGTTKIAALKTAVNNFIDVVASNAKGANVEITTDDIDHQIAIVKYESSATTVSGFKKVATAANVTSLKGSVNNLTADGGTRADLGMGTASTVMNGSTEGHNKVVILFTDGEPGEYGFSTSYNRGNYENGSNGWWVANQTASNSKGMKDGNVSVYTIGVLSDPIYDAIHYLDLVSSNYPTANRVFDDVTGARTRVTTFPKREGANFFQLSDGSDLSSIFEAIASETSRGGATKPLDSETTTVEDVITADFTIPEGVHEDDIKVYTQTVAKTQADGVADDAYVFDGTKVELELEEGDIEFTTVTVEGKSLKKITVKGFDFTKDDYKENDSMVWENDEVVGPGNWVGPREKKEDNVVKVKKYYGSKLIIEIPIVPTPDYQGGYELPTNTGASGLYSNGEILESFTIPTLDFPSLAITKKGLKNGESAMFTVVRTKDVARDNDGNVVYDEDGYPTLSDDAADAVAYHIVLTGKTGVDEVYAILKDIPEGEYSVTEDTSWSWTYTPDGATQITDKLLCKKNAETNSTIFSGTEYAGVKCVIYSFKNNKIEPDKDGNGQPDNAEAVVKNVFKGGKISSPSHSTVNSKAQPTED